MPRVEAQSQKVPARLDLRAPTEVVGSEAANLRTVSGMRSIVVSPEGPRMESPHIMSPLQKMAHDFNQEGLPVAKLFQTNDSLVHLGLSPKGKPGIWLVHKMH